MARGLRSNQAKALRRLRRERLTQMEKAAAAEKVAAAGIPAEAAKPGEVRQEEQAQQLTSGAAVANSGMPNVKSASPATEKSVQQVAEAMDIETPDDKKQQGLGVTRKSLKGRKQTSALNRPHHEKRKKGKKQPRAWFHG